MSNDPQSQATPARAPGIDRSSEQWPAEADHATHYSPRAQQPSPATPDPALGAAGEATHDVEHDHATHYSAADRAHPASQSGYQSIPLAPNPQWAPGASSPWLPSTAATPTGGTDPGSLQPAITGAPTEAGSWAPSHWHLPEDRFQAPVEVVTTQRRSFSITRLLAWVLAVAVVAVVAGVVYVRFIRIPPQDLDTVVPETAASTAQTKILRGDEVVRLYLSALSSGDIETALSYGPAGGNGSTTLLTNEAYAATRKAAPITAVSVPAADDNATTIAASFKVGATTVNTTFNVVKQDNGSWQMAKTTTTFQFRGTQVNSIPLRLNGVPVSWDSAVEVVPGSYVLSTGLPFVAFDQSTALQIQSLNYTGPTTHTVAPGLTEQGRAALIASVRKSVTNCAARKELQPANCPNSLSSPGGPMVPSSIQWKLVGDPLADARPVLSSSDQSQATMNVTVVMTISGSLASGGRINGQQHAFATSVTADMKVTTADQVAPKWK